MAVSRDWLAILAAPFSDEHGVFGSCGAHRDIRGATFAVPPEVHEHFLTRGAFRETFYLDVSESSDTMRTTQ